LAKEAGANSDFFLGQKKIKVKKTEAENQKDIVKCRPTDLYLAHSSGWDSQITHTKAGCSQ
jgi:hypothetical protein